MARKKIYKKVRFEGMYNTGNEYISFPHNEHHNKEFENVPVSIKKEIRSICGIDVEMDVIRVGDNKPLEIECELVKKEIHKDGTLVLKICQDWG